jgi:hypothetical protein
MENQLKIGIVQNSSREGNTFWPILEEKCEKSVTLL